MASYDFFWQSYLQLERELISLSEIILFDDTNIDTYSFKIADLITRVNIEIEALAKKLHTSNGGPAPANPPHLMYDTDCLRYLDTIWTLSKKVVLVVYPFSFFQNKNNIILKPLREAHKMGDDGPIWKRAYQALKHDRSNNITKATVKNLISSMAALFILNIYHKGYTEKFDSIMKLEAIPSSFGSQFFAVKIYRETSLDLSHLKGNDVDVKESTIICYPDSESLKKVREANVKYEEEFTKRIIDSLNKDQARLKEIASSSDVKKKMDEILEQMKDANREKDLNENGRNLIRAIIKMNHIATLNKNQFVTPQS